MLGLYVYAVVDLPWRRTNHTMIDIMHTSKSHMNMYVAKVWRLKPCYNLFCTHVRWSSNWAENKTAVTTSEVSAFWHDSPKCKTACDDSMCSSNVLTPRFRRCKCVVHVRQLSFLDQQRTHRTHGFVRF